MCRDWREAKDQIARLEAELAAAKEREEDWRGRLAEQCGKTLAAQDMFCQAQERAQTARREALEEAARDVCMYCGKRGAGYSPVAEGPNSAGNYTHRSDPDRPYDIVLCHASPIWARLHFEMFND